MSLHYFYIFLYLWWMGACIEFGRYVTASACASWYFSREKSILLDPIWRGVKQSLRYHIGSLLLGSILVLIFWPLKTVMAFVRERIQIQNDRNRKAKTFRLLLAMLSGCVAVFERLVKYIHSRAYLQIAIYGDDFWVACVRMYYLQVRNASRLREIKKWIGLPHTIGKVFLLRLRLHKITHFPLDIPHYGRLLLRLLIQHQLCGSPNR